MKYNILSSRGILVFEGSGLSWTYQYELSGTRQWIFTAMVVPINNVHRILFGILALRW